MTTITWFTVVVMCLAPAFILFVGAGLISIVKKLTIRLQSSSEEIDHDL